MLDMYVRRCRCRNFPDLRQAQLFTHLLTCSLESYDGPQVIANRILDIDQAGCESKQGCKGFMVQRSGV